MGDIAWWSAVVLLVGVAEFMLGFVAGKRLRAQQPSAQEGGGKPDPYHTDAQGGTADA